jgi:activator of HSP90 ATPase
MDDLNIEDVIPASAEQIYNDWLSSEGHTNMTGGEAEASDKPGDSFTAWDGYISGSNVQLTPIKRIAQKWRTVEFPQDAEDSDLVISLERIDDSNTKVIVSQTNLPDGDGPKYTDGWKQHYFEPMKEYYSNK